MRIPTHIVVDTADGWIWARDGDGNPFTEETAIRFKNLLNGERKPDKRTFITAAVVPVLSPELTAVLARDGKTSKVCISCGEPQGRPHKPDCVVHKGTLRE